MSDLLAPDVIAEARIEWVVSAETATTVVETELDSVVVTTSELPAQVVAIEDTVHVVETAAQQGPAGPSGTDNFDTDLVTLYQIAKL